MVAGNANQIHDGEAVIKMIPFKHNDQRRTQCGSQYENVDRNNVYGYTCNDGILDRIACKPSKYI